MDIDSKENANNNLLDEDEKKKNIVNDLIENMDITDEDLILKREIDDLVNNIVSLIDLDNSIVKLQEIIKSSTSTMTSVPKALKFLSLSYDRLREVYEIQSSSSGSWIQILAEIISILSTICSSPKDRQVLKFRLLSKKYENIDVWGEAYLTNLSAEIVLEYNERMQKNDKKNDDLIAIVDTIVKIEITKHGEIKVIDLLCEVERIETLVDYLVDINDEQINRIMLYLQQLSLFSSSQEEYNMFLKLCYEISIKFDKYITTIRILLKINDENTNQNIVTVMKSIKDINIEETPVLADVQCIQIAFILARYGKKLKTGDIKEIVMENSNIKVENKEEFIEKLDKIMSNGYLSENFKYFAKELDVLEGKLPEDVYKTGTDDRGRNSTLNTRTITIDTAKQNLASTYVNCMLNVGFCNDKLVTVNDETNWLYKNKDSGTMAVSASLGAICMWNIDDGLEHIDKYQWSTNSYTKAGALVGLGLTACRIQNDWDPTFALLSEYLDDSNTDYTVKMGAILGLGYSYVCTAREDLLELLVPILMDPYTSFDCSTAAALALGFIFSGTANQSIVEAVLDLLISITSDLDSTENTKKQLVNETSIILYPICLGLLFINKREMVEPTFEILATINHYIGEYSKYLIIGCAYIGSGDVLQIQNMLRAIANYKPNSNDDENDDITISLCVLNISLVCLGDDVSTEMALRSLDNILQYSSTKTRSAVPIALATLSIGNPKPIVIDTISKLTHDSDPDVTLNAIFALGIISSSTNNARTAGLLKQLASYYSKDINALYAVRISQGLLYMGKGLVTINPLYSDKFLFNPVSLTSVLSVLHLSLRSKDTLFGNHHYLIYNIFPAILPRMAITLDNQLNPLQILVRVGQAVDVVGQAGTPRKITGFQTHNTPILVNNYEKAEIAVDDEYIPITDIIEDVVIVINTTNNSN